MATSPTGPPTQQQRYVVRDPRTDEVLGATDNKNEALGRAAVAANDRNSPIRVIERVPLASTATFYTVMVHSEQRPIPNA